MIEHPFGQTPTKDMTTKERFEILQTSVDIIRLTNAVTSYKPIEQWSWYYKGWMQWHSIAIVVAELGNNTNAQFTKNAWAALDPLMVTWDKVYQAKHGEPAWDHVNVLIEKARQQRQQLLTTTASQASTAVPTPAYRSSMSAEQLLSGIVSNTTGNAYIPVQTANNGAYQPSLPQPQIPYATDLPYWTGQMPAMTGIEDDFSYLDGLQDVDFSAFEGVFGDPTWDFSSPSTDPNLEMMQM
jgi:hypothetical protein